MLSIKLINWSRAVALSDIWGAQPYFAGCAPPAILATSGGIVDPGGGTVVEDAGGESLLLSLLLLEFGSKTAPPMLATAVPLTVRIPPRGAFGGMELSPALLAEAMNASKVFPDVGLDKLARGDSPRIGSHTR